MKANENVKNNILSNSTNLYLTEVEIKTQTRDSPNKKIEKQQISSYLIKNQDKFEKTTSNFLDFLVNEETHYTDLMKIEDYFKEKAIEYYQSFNSQVDEIHKKRKLLMDLDKQIEQVTEIYYKNIT
jgi:hypothetical protein